MSNLITRRYAVVLTIVLALFASLTFTIPANATTVVVDAAAEQEYLALLNATRAQYGLQPVTPYWDITDDSRDHSFDMANANSVFHDNPINGGAPSGWSSFSENVGAGPSMTSLHAAFMASSGHRANILRDHTNTVGIGVVRKGSQYYITVRFATYSSSFADSGGTDLCAGSCPESVADSIMLRSSNVFHVFDEASVSAAPTREAYGRSTDIPLMGDWNCNGTKTPGLYRPSNGRFYLDYWGNGTTDKAFYFGNGSTDWPLVGDWNGDGCDGIGLYRKTQGKAYLSNGINTSVEYAFYYGNPSDKPFVGDWDGNGTDTLGLHRESTGQVFLRNYNSQGNANLSFYFGNPGDVMMAGDWDANGTDTVGIYRPSSGYVYLRNSNTQGNADYWFRVGTGFAGASAW